MPKSSSNSNLNHKNNPSNPPIIPQNPKKVKKPLWKTIFFILGLLIWVAFGILISQFAIVFLLYLLLGKETLSTPVWTTIMNALVYSLALFLIIFIPPRLFRRPFRTPKSPLNKNWLTNREQLGLRGLPTWTDIGLAPVGLILYLILAVIFTAVFSNFPFFDLKEAQDVGYNFLASGFDRAVAFFALCVVAPVAEEIIFRGFLYGKLRAKISGKWSLFLSIFLVSLLFGILHGQWNVGVNVFAISLVLCGLREVTGTIYSGIILHIIKNTIAFILLYIIGSGLY